MIKFHLRFYNQKGVVIESICRSAVGKDHVLRAVNWFLKTTDWAEAPNGELKNLPLFILEIERVSVGKEKAET